MCYDFAVPLLIMVPKIAAFVITFLTCVVIGVAVFLVMLMGMNGYHESDATYGLATYGLLGFGISILMALLAALATGKLIKRDFNSLLAVFISIVVFSIIGGVLKGVCCIIGIGVSEFVRVNF
jgi:hypothetical protein